MMTNALRRRGIEIITEHRVTKATQQFIFLQNSSETSSKAHPDGNGDGDGDGDGNGDGGGDGTGDGDGDGDGTTTPKTMEYDMLIWGTGAQAHSCVENFQGLDVTDKSFIRGNEFLQSTSAPNVFVAGDCLSFSKREVAKAGVYAVRAGAVLVDNVFSYTTQTQHNEGVLKRFEPQSDFLRLLNCGDGTAIGAKHEIAFEGRWVFQLKDWVWSGCFDVDYGFHYHHKHHHQYHPIPHLYPRHHHHHHPRHHRHRHRRLLD